MTMNLIGNSSTVTDFIRERRNDVAVSNKLREDIDQPKLRPQMISATGDVDGTKGIVLVDTTGGAVTLTLPIVSKSINRIIVVKDNGNAGTNNIIIDGNGSETIDGSATYIVSSNYGVAQLYCDGVEWFTI